MKFIHAADIHLGASPDAGKSYSQKRAREIWNSFEKLLETCEAEKIDLLLIAGDLFHRQPLLRELKEVNYLFSKLTATQVVMIIGNHDYLKRDSHYHTFPWVSHVHVLTDSEVSYVELKNIKTAVYGASYHSREIYEKPYEKQYANRLQKYEILMVHGGDEKHTPIRKEELLELGYDYIALGHIHKYQEILPGKIAYSGALEPVDTNDVGPHGYIWGEMTNKGCQTKFIPFASREYIQIDLEVTSQMTAYELKELMGKSVKEKGIHNIFKVRLKGFKDPEMHYDKEMLDVYGNITSIEDDTRPAYNMEKIYLLNKDNILGGLIEELGSTAENSIEYMALCEGVRALMETRKN